MFYLQRFAFLAIVHSILVINLPLCFGGSWMNRQVQYCTRGSISITGIGKYKIHYSL
jgi:hypothetical protein